MPPNGTVWILWFSRLFDGGFLLLPEDHATRGVEAGPLVQPEEICLAAGRRQHMINTVARSRRNISANLNKKVSLELVHVYVHIFEVQYARKSQFFNIFINKY